MGKASEFAANLSAQPWKPPVGEQLLPLPSPLLNEFVGLTGPIETFGTCLEGHLEAGDLIWYDARIAPRSGDLVVIQQHPDRQKHFDERYGARSNAPAIGVKRIEQRDGEWFLSADDFPEGFPLGDNVMLGPVVFRLSRLHRGGTHGQVKRLAQRHSELALEMQSFIAKAKSPAQRLIARRQLEQLRKINAKQRALKDAAEAPALPKAHCNSLRFGPGTNLEAVGTPGLEPNSATDLGSVSVNSDSYNFPSASGIQDRTFTAFDYTNNTAETVFIEVTVTGQRRLTTPAGLSGTADFRSWISVLNVTTSTLVSTTQDWLANQIENQAANASQMYSESTAFLTSVPAGNTIRFTPYGRVYLDVGTVGTTTLETTGYTMRVAMVKR